VPRIDKWSASGMRSIPPVVTTPRLVEAVGYYFFWGGGTRKRQSRCLKCIRTHYGRQCEPFSGQNALDCRILHMQSQNFLPGSDTPALRPCAWTQTQFPLVLASVLIIPVLRNDHWPEVHCGSLLWTCCEMILGHFKRTVYTIQS